MSTVALGVSDYPLKYKNSTGASMPAFGIFRLEGGARVNNELIPNAELSAATGSEALYVNSAIAVADEGYGNCRSAGDGPFWVRYNTGNPPANGDVVGPVSGQTYVDDTGTGLVVIYKDTSKELVLCEKLGSGGGGTCPEVHEITTTGSPSAGSADLTYTIGGTGDTITIAYDDTAAEVETAFETHSEVASGDVVVTGGPLPSVAVYVRFTQNLAGVAIALPSISDSITSGDIRLRKAASYDWEA